MEGRGPALTSQPDPEDSYLKEWPGPSVTSQRGRDPAVAPHLKGQLYRARCCMCVCVCVWCFLNEDCVLKKWLFVFCPFLFWKRSPPNPS